MTHYNIISFFGLFVLMGVAWLFSSDKKNMNWRAILWGTAFQFAIAAFVFLVPIGTDIFLFVNKSVIKFLDSAFKGAEFVFGPLAIPPGETGEGGQKSLGFILAFQGLPTIIFFAAFISILYFFGIMQVIIRGFAYAFAKLMKLSGAESLSAASNIFVGIESALTIKPYLEKMTKSELCLVLTAGTATIASSILATYVYILQNQIPTIAGHLVSASLISAPAAIVMAKIVEPEKDEPETLGERVEPYYEKDRNFFTAIINGANSGVKMIVGIVALLIAVVSLVALANQIVGLLGDLINWIFGTEIDLSLEKILGYVFYPFTLLIGIPLEDAAKMSEIIGERIIVTELVSYQDLAEAINRGQITNPRSMVVGAYALCGFAHFASIAIFTGGISALVPNKTKVLTSVALKALFAAVLATLATACVAGVFYVQDPSIIEF